MYRFWMTLGALASWFLLGHLGLIAILAYVWITAMTSTANTPKARSTEQRVSNLVGSVATANGRIGNLSGQSTSTNGLSNGQINGHTDTAGLADGTIGGQSGPQIGGASAHVHGGGSYSVNNGHHEHGANASDGNLSVADGTHHHTTPVV